MCVRTQLSLFFWLSSQICVGEGKTGHEATIYNMSAKNNEFSLVT